LKSYDLKFKFQADLAFAARQSLGNRAKAYDRLVTLYGGWVAIIQKVEELEETLNPEALAHDPSPGNAQVHIDERRSGECIAPRQQIAAIEIAIAILVDRHFSGSGVVSRTSVLRQTEARAEPRSCS